MVPRPPPPPPPPWLGLGASPVLGVFCDEEEEKEAVGGGGGGGGGERNALAVEMDRVLARCVTAARGMVGSVALRVWIPRCPIPPNTASPAPFARRRVVLVVDRDEGDRRSGSFPLCSFPSSPKACRADRVRSGEREAGGEGGVAPEDSRRGGGGAAWWLLRCGLSRETTAVEGGRRGGGWGMPDEAVDPNETRRWAVERASGGARREVDTR